MVKSWEIFFYSNSMKNIATENGCKSSKNANHSCWSDLYRMNKSWKIMKNLATEQAKNGHKRFKDVCVRLWYFPCNSLGAGVTRSVTSVWLSDNDWKRSRFSNMTVIRTVVSRCQRYIEGKLIIIYKQRRVEDSSSKMVEGKRIVSSDPIII